MRPGPEPPAPGPARLGAAVDAIVGHLRRLVLLQAWAKWQPTLTQVRGVAVSPCPIVAACLGFGCLPSWATSSCASNTTCHACSISRKVEERT